MTKMLSFSAFCMMLLSSLLSYGQSFSPDPPVQIPGSATAASPVFSSYDSITGQFIATWRDDSTIYPYYATFDGSSWSEPAAITTSSKVGTEVITSFDANSGVLLATWLDVATATPFYSIYASGSWGAATAIPLPVDILPTAQGLDISNSFNSNSGTFLITWAAYDPISLNVYPYYITYNYEGDTWSTATGIPGSPEPQIFSDIYSSFSPDLGLWLVTWSDENNIPTYATFDGTDWSEPAEFYIYFSGSDVIPTYDPTSETFMATWIDGNTGYAFYAIFDGTDWNTPAAISTGYFANSDIVPIFDVASDLFFVTWTDYSTQLPFYSIFDGTSWSTPAAIPGSSTAIFNIWTSSNEAGVFIAWKDYSSNDPYYTFVTFTSSTTLDLTSSINPSFYGQALNFTATVVPSPLLTPAPTGTVTFYVDGNQLGSPVSVSDLQAISIAISNLTVGSHLVQAIYSGDANYVGSEAELTQVVNAPAMPLPPPVFQGKVYCRCILEHDFLLMSWWKPSPTPGVTFYRIYENSELVDEIRATDPHFYKTPVYSRYAAGNFYIAAVSSENIESAHVKITIIH